MLSIRVGQSEVQGLNEKLNTVRHYLELDAERLEQDEAVRDDAEGDPWVMVMASTMSPVPMSQRRTLMPRRLVRLTLSIHRKLPLAGVVMCIAGLGGHTLTLLACAGWFEDSLHIVYIFVVIANLLNVVSCVGLANKDIAKLTLGQFEVKFFLFSILSIWICLLLLMPLRLWFLVFINTLTMATGPLTDASPLLHMNNNGLIAAVLCNLVFIVGMILGVYFGTFEDALENSAALSINVGNVVSHPIDLVLTGLWTLAIYHFKYSFHAIARPCCCLILHAPIVLVQMPLREFDELCAAYDAALLSDAKQPKKVSSVLDTPAPAPAVSQS